MPPTCNRDRDNAASQASALEGVSTICVAVGWPAGVPVDVGVNICVGDVSTEAVGEGSENGVGVSVLDDVSVAVGDGSVGGVAVDTLDVAVGDGSGSSVGGALVGVSFACGVSVGKSGGVLVGGSGWGALAGSHNSKQINSSNRTIATTSLNRSYPGARVDVSMLSP